MAAEKLEAGKAYHEQLLAMPDVELFALHRELHAARMAEIEREHWSNKPPALATADTYDHWSKAAYWKMDEAAALLIGRNPSTITQRIAQRDSARSNTLASFLALHDLIDRAITAKQINFNYGPGGYLAWARRNRIDIPADLEAAVLKHGHQIDDWKGISDRQALEIAELTARIAELESSTDSVRQPDADATLGARERDSLLKLVIGMAIAGYRYDPKAARNAAVTEIADDLAKAGIPLDPDTVRRYLNEAKVLLPPQTDQER